MRPCSPRSVWPPSLRKQPRRSARIATGHASGSPALSSQGGAVTTGSVAAGAALEAADTVAGAAGRGSTGFGGGALRSRAKYPPAPPAASVAARRKKDFASMDMAAFLSCVQQRVRLSGPMFQRPAPKVKSGACVSARRPRFPGRKSGVFRHGRSVRARALCPRPRSRRPQRRRGSQLDRSRAVELFVDRRVRSRSRADCSRRSAGDPPNADCRWSGSRGRRLPQRRRAAVVSGDRDRRRLRKRPSSQPCTSSARQRECV